MIILNTAIITFIVLEVMNILILYFIPKTKTGNGMGVFKHYETLTKDHETKLFISYLVNWVANAKVIFILLLLVILIFGDVKVKQYAVIAMVVSISMYYISLHPKIKKLDSLGFIEPKGYSKKLLTMIASIQTVFFIAFILYFLI